MTAPTHPTHPAPLSHPGQPAGAAPPAEPVRPVGSAVAIVTGASQGLGLALADALADRGWALVVDARRTDRLDAAVARPRAPAPTSSASPATSPTRRTAPSWLDAAA